jgi:nitrogen regulatory protein PII-like uncharacterized protein
MYLNETHVYTKGIGRVLNCIKMILNHIGLDGFYNINYEGNMFFMQLSLEVLPNKSIFNTCFKFN